MCTLLLLRFGPVWLARGCGAAVLELCRVFYAGNGDGDGSPMEEEDPKRAAIYSGRMMKEKEVSCSLAWRQDRLEGLQGARPQRFA